MNIIKKFITQNVTAATGRKIEYICVHDTGNSSSGANAEMHYRYFNSGNRNASADFFVDDKQILQIVNSDNYYSWAVGDGKGAYGITNRNSISIEMCINSDGNFDKTLASTIQLVKYLMSKYKIPFEKVVRHYDASRKICPGKLSANNWAKWSWFKQQIKINTTPTPAPEPVIPEWKLEGLKGLKDEGLLLDYDSWLKKLDESINTWTVFLILHRINKKLSENKNSTPETTPMPTPEPKPEIPTTPEIPEWKIEGLNGLYQEKLILDYDSWLKKLDDNITVWTAFLLLYRIYIKMNEKK